MLANRARAKARLARTGVMPRVRNFLRLVGDPSYRAALIRTVDDV
jgi:hypothetical protein